MKQFLPFLTDDIGRSLRVQDEVVVTSSIPDPLDNSPDGWENNTIQFARNNEFRAIIKSYTTSLKFYLHGAKILRDAFYRKGMETILYFIWLKLNTTFGAGMKHESWYKGEPDLGTFKDKYDGVEVSITEGGFYKDLQANKAVIQEIPFDNDRVKLYMDGMNIRQKLNYSFVDGVSYVYVRYIPSFSLVSNDGNSVSVTFLPENFETISGAAGADEDYVRDSDNFFLRNDGSLPVTINISGTIMVRSSLNSTAPPSSTTLKIKSNVDNGFGGTIEYILFAVTPTVSTVYTYPINLDVTVVPGEKLFMMGITSSVNDILYNFEFMPESNLSITFITRQPSNVIDAMRVFTLGNKLTANVSPGSTLSSPLLEPDFNLLVTSGDAIRNLPDAVIKTTFSDWHKSVDAVKCVALEVLDNKPVLSSRYDKFLKDSQIAALGECSKWELTPADDYIYDGIDVGYPSKGTASNIDVNGKYSFNNTFVWKINVTRRKVNSYQAKSVYFADPYDIELIRVNFNQKDTTTANTDNSNFFIDAELKQDFSFTGTTHFYHSDNRIEIDGDISAIEPFLIVGIRFSITGSVSNDGQYTITQIIDIVPGQAAVFEVFELVAVTEDVVTTLVPVNLYNVRRLPYTTITGIPDDGTVFNIELSPKRIMRNHLPWLRSSFDHLDQNRLVFKTTEKNSLLETIDAAGNVINEKADVLVTDMGTKVYLPYFVSFEIKSPDNLLKLMTANNSGKFDYLRNGVVMDGFPIDIKTNDATLATQTYKLLQTANNDNTQLINNR